MSFAFGANCEDVHVASRLFLKLDLGLQRETVLHFFDSVRREFPSLRKLRRREDGSLLLEEDDVYPGAPDAYPRADDADSDPLAPDESPGANCHTDGSRRWLRLDPSAIRLGHYNPPSLEEAARLGEVILRMAPYHLTLGELDYDHLEVVLGFDLEYRGNHDQLVADTLFAEGPLAGLFNHEDVRHAIDVQPFIGMTLSERCDTQAYLEIKSRTSTYEVRTDQFDPQPLSVFLTLRRYWGFEEAESLIDVHRDLMQRAEEWAVSRVVPLVVNPLAHAIASRP